MSSYTEAEIDQLCSIQLSGLQECTTNLLKKLASDMRVPDYTSMNKSQLCAALKKVLSLGNSERLVQKCGRQIQGLELYYDPTLHGTEVGKTVQQLKQWYNDHIAKIERIRTTGGEKTVFDLSTQYAEVNGQCGNLINAVAEQALQYSKAHRR